MTQLMHEKFAWYVDFEIGTPETGMPAQKFSLSVDTGSSDIWVNSPASKYCQTVDDNCRLAGTYDESASTSKAVIDHDFSTQYVSGEKVTGDDLTDTFYVAGQYLDFVQFGVASDSTGEGVFGHGYSLGEAVARDDKKKIYPTIVDAMVRKNMINLKAFSMWLDNPKIGHILYGGIDTAKFLGQLITVPVVPSRWDKLDAFVINLMDVQFSDQAKPMKLPLDTFPFPVTLDSGSTATFLPINLVREIHRVLQITEPGSLENGLISCSLMQSDLTLDFAFGTTAKPAMIKIPIPMSALFRPRPRGGLCRVQILPDLNNIYSLGINFLSEAYIVYDMTNNQISLAPVKKGVSDSNIVEIDPSGVVQPGESMSPDFKNLAGQTEAEIGSDAEAPWDFTSGSNAVHPDDIQPAQKQMPVKESAFALNSESVQSPEDVANMNSAPPEFPLPDNLDGSLTPNVDDADNLRPVFWNTETPGFAATDDSSRTTDG